MVASKKKFADTVTPLTRCSNCLTVFEVPRELLESPDTRVRCGECLNIFDALDSLYTVENENFEVPVGAAPPSQTSAALQQSAADLPSAVDSGASKVLPDRQETKQDRPTPVAARQSKAAAPSVSSVQSATHDRSANKPAAQIKKQGKAEKAGATMAQVASDDLPADALGDAGADLDVTYSDFDLFSDDAELPEHAFMDETRDAIDLNFDQVSLEHDETFSDTLFNNDVTIDAALPIGKTAEPGSGRNAAAAKSRRAETGFTSDRVAAPLVVEIDPSGKGVDKKRPSAAAGRPTTYPAAQPTSRAASSSTHGGSNAAVSAAADQVENFQSQANSPVSSIAASSVAQAAKPGRAELPTSAGKVTELHPRSSVPRKWLINAMLAGLLVLLALGLYGYQNRSSLSNNSGTRPLVKAWCFIARCEVPHRFDKQQLRVLRKNVFSHPTEDNALVINVVIKNIARFEQRYPVLEVTLSDLAGRAVLRKDFEPTDYLADIRSDNLGAIAVDQSVDITLKLEDPGKDANSFELKFR